MPDKDLTESAFRLLPWVIGLLASVVAVFLRNEWTTNSMKNALFSPDGDLRLVRIKDCEGCRNKCQESMEKVLAAAKQERDGERAETKADIQRINDKIDELPTRIITLMRETRRPSIRPENK